jgi:hypothetical protein
MTEANPPFDPGDRIRLAKNEGMNAEAGAEAIVQEHPLSWPKLINVKWIRDGRDHREKDGNFYPYRFEIISKAVVERIDLGRRIMDEKWGPRGIV